MLERRRGLTQDVRVLVGLPMLTSASAFAFWLDLCRAGRAPGAEAALRSFRQADAGGSGAAFCQQYTADLIKRVSLRVSNMSFHSSARVRGAPSAV